MSDKQQTRDKLIGAAKELFAEKGYKETSIRDIAKSADANLNAVNYHFENKRNLYLEVIATSKRDFGLKISKLLEPEVPKLNDFVIELYNLFRDNGNEFLNNIKIHLDQTFSFEELHKAMCKQDFCEAGPPGFNSFIKVLDNEFGTTLSNKAKIWIARTTAIQIFHMAILFTRKSDPSYIPKHFPKDLFCTPEISLTLHVDALIQYSLNNPDKFE